MKNVYKRRLKKYIKKQSKLDGVSIAEEKEIIVDNWGYNGLRGYAIFESDDFLGEHIEKIDEMNIYDNDLEAGKQAEKDGISLIPFNELPKNYPYDCYRFIDTLENREAIKKDYEESNTTNNTEYNIF